MSYCLNPDCQKPQNPPGTKFCLGCGTQLGLLKDRYRIIRLISDEGGFARTYLAEDEGRGGAKCAIKQLVPLPEVQGNPQLLAKAIALFEQEAERLLKLEEHPQIPILLDCFAENKQRYLVQQFVEGQDLSRELQQHGAFGERQIRELLQDLLPVLQFIHDRHIIHRDIKPANIMRRQKDGKLVLIDFGISKQLAQTVMSKTGTAGIGTQGYAPMEQLLTGKAYPASDIYSLGVTCIHLLTGADPEELYDPREGCWLWRDYLLQGTKVSEDLGCLLDKMIGVMMRDRFSSVEEVAIALNGSATDMLLDPMVSEFAYLETGINETTETVVVAKLGAADYRTIGEAIANVLSNTLILVRPGFYAERLVIDKSVKIVGDGAREDIIVESKLSPCLQMQADNVVVRGITLRHRDWTNVQKVDRFGRWIIQFLFKPYAIDISEGQLILENCDITSTGVASINIRGTADPRLRRCRVGEGANYGILVRERGRGILEFCDIDGQDTGICILKGANPAILRCQIHNMTADGIVVAKKGEGKIEDCDIFTNAGTGVRIKKGGNLAIARCNIYGNREQGIYVESNGAGPIENCDLRGNDRGAWYVATQCAVRRSGNLE